ncbi:sulfur oxidation c-type cytochrome SoxX [Magnetovibrio sp.]|uniref:sulfur oxidation c-type cytochrome SoxX n=1 Tax=Magnetovibrio sp. TaxID=2024836 RepID=UPI002F94691D
MKHTKLMSAFFGLTLAGTIAASAQAEEMAQYSIVDDSIPASLTGKAGDAANGKKVVINRKKGNCLACHVMPIPEEQFHGKTGPDLAGVAQRLDEATLRMRIVDPKVINHGTMMPSFYKTDQHRVLKKFQGKTILSAQEVEDVVAYLMTLN